MKSNLVPSFGPSNLRLPVMVLLVFLLPASVSVAHPLDELELVYPLPTGQELNNSAYGNGTYVIVGKGGTVVTSTDGVNWEAGNVGRGSELKDVIFVNGQFVAVGTGRCFTSSDGLSWTETASGLGVVDRIAYGDGVYVSVGTFGNMTASTDLENWTPQDLGHTTHLYDVAFGAGRFVAVGNSGIITQGTVDGGWVTTTEATVRLNAAAYADGMFVVGGHSGHVLTSTDGITWTDQGSIGASALWSVEYGDGAFVASGNFSGDPRAAIYRSTNGTEWSPVESTRLTQFIDGGGFGDGRFVLLGGFYILTSEDGGLTWDFPATQPMIVPNMAEFSNGMFFGVQANTAYGFRGTVTSTDGVVWVDSDTSSTGIDPANIHSDVTAGAGKFLICGRGPSPDFAGYILETEDGASWTMSYTTGADPATVGGIWGVDFANGKYLACGSRGRILFSDDALNWEEKRFEGSLGLRGMTYGGGLYVAVGDIGTILTSPDGAEWTEQTSGVTSTLSDVAFNNGRFVAVAQDSTTMITSVDGSTWEPIGSTPTIFPVRIKVVDGEFVVTGLTSTDGVTWEPHDFLGDVVYDGTSYFTYRLSIYKSVTTGNEPPVIEPIDVQSTDEGVEFSLQTVATDPETGTLAYSIESGPEGLTIEPSTGLITWIPTEAQGPGEYTVSVTVQDDAEPPASVSTDFMITVNEVNTAPVLADLADTTVDELTPLSVSASATDSDVPAQGLSYDLGQAPEGMTIDPASGAIDWTPTEAQGPGNYVVTVTVSDDGDPALQDEKSFNVAVAEVNLAPTVVVTGEIPEGEVGTELIVSLAITDPDEGQTHTGELIEAPPGSALSVDGRQFTWIPETSGTFSVTVRVTDDGNPPLFGEVMFSVTAVGTSAPPRIETIAITDGMVAITFDDTLVLQQAASLDGPWSDVPGATSPYSIQPQPGMQFFRLMSTQ